MVNMLICLLSFIAVLPSQNRNDLAFIARVNPIYAAHGGEEPGPDFDLERVSETRLLLGGLVRAYQLWVSPQGPPACNFTVTCSQFMANAIGKYGVFHGLLMSSDRLTRCIRAGRRYYPIDSRTGRAIDYSVEAYFLGSPKRCVRNPN